MNTPTIVAFVFGVIFLVTMLIIAIKIPNPTGSQARVFRTVLALAAAGIAAALPGLLQISLPAKITISATGALAVFVIVYFYDPGAQLAKLMRARG